MNESLVKYLAGLLDADGSLSFSFKRDHNRKGRNYIGLTLSLASSKKVDKHCFVEKLPELTGMGVVSYYGDEKQYKSWAVNSRSDLEKILPRLVKHMIIKAKHWQWLLDLWRNIRADNKTVSDEEREMLTQASKESRRNRCGPLRQKNYPTWAWLAGYLDGDGWYTCRSHMNGKYKQWAMNVGAVAHENDICVLEFLQNTFGGSIRGQGQSDHVFVWVRSVGYQQRSFALEFLSKLARFSNLKREKIDAMIHHHQQRLSVPGTEKTYCKVDGCKNQNHGHGMCSMHYQRCKRQSNKVT